VCLIRSMAAPGTKYMVFEYVSGGELFDDIVKRTHYNEHDARCARAQRA
jgi:hypothetical protein